MFKRMNAYFFLIFAFNISPNLLQTGVQPRLACAFNAFVQKRTDETIGFHLLK